MQRRRSPFLIKAINRKPQSYCLIDCGIILSRITLAKMNQHQRVIKRLALMLDSRCSWLWTFLIHAANFATLTVLPFGQQSTRKERVIKAPFVTRFNNIFTIDFHVHGNHFKYSNPVADIDLTRLNQCRCGDMLSESLQWNVVTRIWWLCIINTSQWTFSTTLFITKASSIPIKAVLLNPNHSVYKLTTALEHKLRTALRSTNMNCQFNTFARTSTLIINDYYVFAVR